MSILIHHSSSSYPTIDYGWYVYKGNENHRLFAKPVENAIGALIRSAEGNSYAKLHIKEIKYEGANATSPSKWIFELDIQPKAD